ncbi:xenobiotic compound family monooxygenase [Lophiotrema nucula]|uniref:Xenobiotic compound family monooxygenase n=1 Tax=Lophiotrema nucula TaxID=690887 RepID=A0A6A5ZMN4_9PLEO|nr:xenobiotic compound family monooxygenase [Lophiotrema nucula]
MSTPGHLASGLWRHPRNRTSQYIDIEYWTDLARILEAGKFHGLFIADVLGHYGVYRGAGNIDAALPGAAQFPNTDPFLPITAMAAVTKKLSFGVTASTTYENPFLLARRFATLDHLTKGRIAWNVVTSHLESAATNVGLETQVPHDERYKMADEYLIATYKLWEGAWRDDAVIKDDKQYTVPGRVRYVNPGKYFKTAGPLTTEPSIQRTPFIFQAGASSSGKAFATKHAECMFLIGMDPKTVRKTVEDVRKQAVEQGRNPNTIKTIARINIIVDDTDEKAHDKYQEYLSYADLEGSLTLFGGWTGTDLSTINDDEDLKFTGPGAIQSMVSSCSATVPGTENVKWRKARVARELAIGGPHPKAIGSPYHYQVGLPELRARGVFWDDYSASTTRENYQGDGRGPRLRDDHPGSKYRWRAD